MKDTKVWDPVNNPVHYAARTSLECIDCMEVMFGAEMVANFCLVNAFKYLWRYEYKNGQEDLDKAEWYLDAAAGVITGSDIKPERAEWMLELHRRLYSCWCTQSEKFEEKEE